jgi:hypothetical protein
VDHSGCHHQKIECPRVRKRNDQHVNEVVVVNVVIIFNMMIVIVMIMVHDVIVVPLIFVNVLKIVTKVVPFLLYSFFFFKCYEPP